MSYSNSQSNMSHLNTTFDYDSYLNLDNEYTPATTSPDIKPVPMLTPQSSIPGSATTFASSSTPIFPGPSFQYDRYHQQTGIPIGALANTFSINKANGLQYHESNGGFIMPIETLNMPLSNLDEFDFSRNPSDMDFDTESPDGLPTIFYPDASSSTAQFVSPNTLVSKNNTTSGPVQRIYPGMHSHQAAQAKAQQAQKQEMARQQQLEQQQSKGQKPLPGPSPTKTQPAKDPLVEESISKVLNRMRQASVVSAADSDTSPVTGMSSMPRIKKDEDDMDEDELLLASEEGKKLSSKERRQLRNKVSARAFRSRRKEYIGQLEGEVAAKAQEANDLRAQNQQLREENNRLTDLTRMLLSSQAFSGFLQELSQSGLPAPTLQSNTQQQKPVQNKPQSIKKDVGAQEAAQQMHLQQPQIGMALIPDTPVDYSALQPSNGWMTSLPTNDFQVYAVTELPEPPVLNLEALSGKPTSSKAASKEAKQMPRLPEIPSFMQRCQELVEQKVDDSVSLDEDAFTLYFESTVSPLPARDTTTELPSVEEATETADDDHMAILKELCLVLDEACAKLSEFAPHMK